VRVALAVVALLLLLPARGDAFWSRGGTANPSTTCLGLHAPPAAAAAFGLTDMTSTASYDLADTGNPGFAFYIHNEWPTPALAEYWWRHTTPTDPSTYTISSSGITIHQIDETNLTPWPFDTCVYNPTYPPGYVGTAFKPPFYIEVDASWTGSQTGSWGPTAWMADVREFVPTPVPFSPSEEIDLFEYTYGTQLHEWVIDTGTTGPVADWGIGLPLPSEPFGTMVITPSMNGGVGLVNRYGNNTLIGSLTFSPTDLATATTGSINNNAIGRFSDLPNESECLQFSSSTGFDFTIRSIRVWTTPP
jgi:hypothetical protein